MPLPWVLATRTPQAAIALIVKGGADAHMPDLSAARHTPLEAAVMSGYRALSHRLVILVDNRQKAEQKRHALLESFAVASREVQYFPPPTFFVWHAPELLEGCGVCSFKAASPWGEYFTDTYHGVQVVDLRSTRSLYCEVYCFVSKGYDHANSESFAAFPVGPFSLPTPPYPTPPSVLPTVSKTGHPARD